MYSKEGKLIDRRELLRIKLKNLADEARLIRREEQKQKNNAKRIRAGWTRKDGTVVEGRAVGAHLLHEMREHRIHVVRWEARHTLIAYGLIRGKTMEQIERKGSKPFDQSKVDKMLKAYGPAKVATPAPVAMAA